MNTLIINKKKLTEKEIKYNFNTSLCGVLISYKNEVFIVEHNIALDSLLQKDVFNLKGIVFPDTIFAYDIYQDGELPTILKLDNILYIMVGTVDDFKEYYISVTHKKIIEIEKLKLIEKELSKLLIENSKSIDIIEKKYKDLI